MAKQYLSREELESYPRSQAGLMKWAMDTFGMDGAAIGKALTAKVVAPENGKMVEPTGK